LGFSLLSPKKLAVSMFDLEIQSIESLIRSYLVEKGLPPHDGLQWNPIPFAGEWGISTSFFQLAAQEARTGKDVNVPQRAHELALQVANNLGTPPGFSRVEAVKGYLNLYYETADFSLRVIDEVLNQGEDFGRGAPNGERLMVEYAQPNTHHSFHIGHYRNAILGEAFARLVEFAGFETIRATYPGDIGLGVITVVWAYNKFYKGQEPAGVHERGQWLLKIYVEAIEMLTPKEMETLEERQRREAYDAERREWLLKWDAGDPEVRRLWRLTRQWSLDELNEIFKMLGIQMDEWFFESQVNELTKDIVGELIDLGIAEDERPIGGPVLVKIDEKLDLSKEKYRTVVLLRNDGTALYPARDLALAREKFEKFHVDRSIYVIDVRQSLNMQQVFKILELWGFPQAAKCYHLGYGFVSLPEGAMSARRGRLVLFKEVADEAHRRVLEIIAEKNPGLDEPTRQRVAWQIGLGALAFSMLSVDNNKDIVFDWDTALNFDGHTAPYIQNAHVRANSILKKAGQLPEQATFDFDLSSQEIELIDMISRFPTIVQMAARDYKPLPITSYAYELARTFHAFYHEIPVLQAETNAIRRARLRLVAALKQTLANSLNLLAIEAPDVM
jgi:arginyl-tRNA synthetase